MKFTDYPLAPEIKRAIGKLGWKRPTDIQYKAIRHILKGEDVMGIAQTGTGKTAAFAIPVLQMIHTGKENQRRRDGIKCLVMVPTRELAMQLDKVFSELARGTRVNVFALTGGVEQDPQIEQLQDGVDILIATPGRMFDLLNQGRRFSSPPPSTKRSRNWPIRWSKSPSGFRYPLRTRLPATLTIPLFSLRWTTNAFSLNAS